MYTIIGADGKEYGPVPADKVRDWIANGRANADTRIKAVDSTAWTTIGALPEFNAPAAAASPVPAPAALPAGGSPFTAPVTVATGTFEPADRGTRLLAAILDSLIAFGFMLPGFTILMVAGAFAGAAGSEPEPAPLFAGLGLLGVGAIALLVIQVWMLTTRGQTMGKRIMSVRIVKYPDYSNPGFVHAVLLRAIVNGAIGAIPVVGGIYTLVDILFIFREDRRCIHDLIAGTVVVKA